MNTKLIINAKCWQDREVSTEAQEVSMETWDVPTETWNVSMETYGRFGRNLWMFPKKLKGVSNKKGTPLRHPFEY